MTTTTTYDVFKHVLELITVTATIVVFIWIGVETVITIGQHYSAGQTQAQTVQFLSRAEKARIEIEVLKEQGYSPKEAWDIFNVKNPMSPATMSYQLDPRNHIPKDSK